MEKRRFAVVGSGWRSLFYWRVARACPERLEMTALVCRSEEKAERLRRETGAPTVVSEEEALATKPDFVVVAVNKASICEVTCHWAEMGIPVLCETPAAMTLEDLNRMWRLREQGARIQVAEQYFLYPTLAAGIAAVEKGYLGEPYAMDISVAHDYHGISLIRRFLKTGFSEMTLSGKRYVFPVEETDSRYGPVADGRVLERERARLTFSFADEKAAFYDFGGVQYHSFIRGRHLRVQGQRGELDDGILRYVDENHVPHEERMVLEQAGAEGYRGIRRIWMGEELLYDNPLMKENGLEQRERGTEKQREGSAENGPETLNQDETAVASLLLGMDRYLKEGIEVYPLAEALQDAYGRILMEEALASGQPVTSRPQPWKRAAGDVPVPALEARIG